MTDKFNSIPKIVGAAALIASLGSLFFEYTFIKVVNVIPEQFIPDEIKPILIFVSVLMTIIAITYNWCIYGTVAVVFETRNRVAKLAGEAGGTSVPTSEPSAASEFVGRLEDEPEPDEWKVYGAIGIAIVVISLWFVAYSGS